jgi:hypothetical protein
MIPLAKCLLFGTYLGIVMQAYAQTEITFEDLPFIKFQSNSATPVTTTATKNNTVVRQDDLNAPPTDDGMDMMYSQLYFYMGTRVKYIFKNLET